MALLSKKLDRLGSTLSACARQLWSVYGFLLACSILFWYLRILYWKEVHEAPFSDIWGYVVTGDNIAQHFSSVSTTPTRRTSLRSPPH